MVFLFYTVEVSKGSKIILWVLFLSIFASAYFLYDRYLVRQDFEVFKTEDGIPLVEEE
jgi:hypothetical protein